MTFEDGSSGAVGYAPNGKDYAKRASTRGAERPVPRSPPWEAGHDKEMQRPV